MLFVVNTLRPFTSTADEILVMKTNLEFVSRQRITEFICNTNLMEDTTPELVSQGIAIIKQAALLSQTAFKTYLVLSEYENLIPDNLDGLKREVMSYTLKKPWEMLISKGI